MSDLVGYSRDLLSLTGMSYHDQRVWHNVGLHKPNGFVDRTINQFIGENKNFLINFLNSEPKPGYLVHFSQIITLDYLLEYFPKYFSIRTEVSEKGEEKRFLLLYPAIGFKFSAWADSAYEASAFRLVMGAFETWLQNSLNSN